MKEYAISCDVESGLVLSNKRALDTWEALQSLVRILVEVSGFSSLEVLNSWKQPHHLANAREPYAWRSVLEEIKNSNLREKCAGVEGEYLTLITDKPTMLKVAGEITNSLLHSYTMRHALTFGQYVSKVPS